MKSEFTVLTSAVLAVALILFTVFAASCASEVRDAEGTKTYVIDPVVAGPFDVASGVFELDPARESNAVKVLRRSVRQYAGGMRSKAEGKLTIASLLPESSAAFLFTLRLPDDSNLAGFEAGKDADYAGILLYPTASNGRFDFKVSPEYGALPRMARGNEPPLFADPAAKYPLVVFCHGWTADPLVHLPELRLLASHGYVVLALFFGDNRWDARDTRLQQLLPRPLAVRAALDRLEKDTLFSRYIDFKRVGAAGVSAGGCTAFLLAGAKPHGDIDVSDPRIRAAVGFIPVLGGGWWGSEKLWGKDYEGVTNMRTPFLALNGTKDEIAPAPFAEAVLNRAPDVKLLVTLDGERHGVSAGAQKKGNTWMLLFLDAFVKGDPGALETLSRLDSVRGKKPADKVMIRQGLPEPEATPR